MRRSLFALGILAALSSTVLGASAPPDQTATVQALGTMLRQAQDREVEALVQVFTLRAQMASLMKRAEAAEAKLPKPELPASVAPKSDVPKT